MLLGRKVYGANVTEDCEIQVTNKDGILVSDEELKEQYIKEISLGIRSIEEYRQKFFGEDEEKARKMIALANAGTEILPSEE